MLTRIGLAILLGILPGCGDSSGPGGGPGPLEGYAKSPGRLACMTTRTVILQKQVTKTCEDIAETTASLDSTICDVEKTLTVETVFLDGSCPLAGATGVCIELTSPGNGVYWVGRTYYYQKADGSGCVGGTSSLWIPL